MARQERLFLLDGMALAYRAYYSMISRPLINSRGFNTGAIYGFVTALLKILEEEKPDHLAVVFDTPEPTFRHAMYPGYKATRQKMPEDMAAQVEKLKETVRAFHVPLLELPGFEADDIIGTLARRAEREGVVTYMVTGDKDYMQLISPLVKMYKPGKAGGEPEIVDEAGVYEKFGVAPHQVIDVLGLMGDASDNIPGVPGIGPKTATPLIQKYGSIPDIYRQLDTVQQKGLREKLALHKDTALLSRELVTINTEVPAPVDFHSLRATMPDLTLLSRLFEELEFRSLIARVTRLAERSAGMALPSGGEGADRGTPTLQTPSSIRTDKHIYHCIADAAALTALCAELAGATRVVIDTETTSQDPLNAALVGISLCMQEGEAFFIPVRPHGDTGEGHAPATLPIEPADNWRDAFELDAVVPSLKPILEDPSIAKIGQNIKFDMLVLRNHGITLRGVGFDTMVASYILRTEGQHNLDALAMEYLNYTTVSYTDLVGRGKQQKHITQVPIHELAQYSAEDADITLRICRRQIPQLQGENLLKLCEEVEFPLISVLERMEAAGISLDVPYLREMAKDLERQLQSLVEEIHRLAGERFNINSTQQLADTLFNKLGLRKVKKTKTGFSTDVSVLEELQGEHPIIDRLLDYRQTAKLKSTYVDALPELVNPRTRRVHTSFNQTVAATGRLSSSDPNLQNIPIRTELGRAIRRAFVPQDSGWVLMAGDYSQIELRVMAHLSGDEGLLEAFRNKEDIHSSTAAKVFGVPLSEITPLMRRKAKEVNFGIMYGIGPFGLSKRLDIPQPEAKAIILKYFDRFPKVRQYVQDTIASARSRGYVETMLGRRRHLPDINSRNQNLRSNAERQAINMPVQGSAADMIKIAMIAIDREILNARMKSRMLLQVHDELVLEVAQEEIAEMKRIVDDKMRNALPLSLPVEVDIGIGTNWLEAH